MKGVDIPEGYRVIDERPFGIIIVEKIINEQEKNYLDNARKLLQHFSELYGDTSLVAHQKVNRLAQVLNEIIKYLESKEAS